VSFLRWNTSGVLPDALRRFRPHRITAALLVTAGVSPCVWIAGSANPFTPAGYVGYLTRGAVLGQSQFYGTQRGPISPGRKWLLAVTNVSITPYTYTEDFIGDEAVLSRDNLKIAFRVHTVWRIDETRIPMFMERFSTTVANATLEKDPDAITGTFATTAPQGPATPPRRQR
jgi:hypothetical protein